MQPVTYAWDREKTRGANLAAIIGGMLAACSMILIFLLAPDTPTQGVGWFWLSLKIIWSLLVLASFIYVVVRWRRVLLMRSVSFVLWLTLSAFGFAGRAVLETRDLLVSEGAAPWMAESVLLPLVIAAVSLLGAVLWTRKGGTLTVGDDGLKCAFGDECLRWAWNEVPAFEVRAPGGLTDRIFGRQLVVERLDGGQEVILTDVWNKPLDEIADQLNQHRDGALASRNGLS